MRGVRRPGGKGAPGGGAGRLARTTRPDWPGLGASSGTRTSARTAEDWGARPGLAKAGGEDRAGGHEIGTRRWVEVGPETWRGGGEARTQIWVARAEDTEGDWRKASALTLRGWSGDLDQPREGGQRPLSRGGAQLRRVQLPGVVEFHN